MGIGTVLVGIACALAVGAYLARPFRKTGMDVDRKIESWVAQARSGVWAGGGMDEREKSGAVEQRGRGSVKAVNFCPQCGRRVGPNDRFCPGCGTRLPGGAE